MDPFKYPHPVARMVLEKFRFDSEKSTHEKTVLGHHFNHSVNVILPNTSKVQDSLFADEENEYYVAKKVPLQKFIGKEFIGAFIKTGNFYAMTINTRIDVDNCIAIIPPGIMVMSLDKDTYESLGLQGEKSRYHMKTGNKFIVKLDMTMRGFVPGKKLYDRAAKMLHLVPVLDYIFTWIPKDDKISTLSVKTYIDTWGVETGVCHTKENFTTKRNVPVPVISPIAVDGDDKNWNYREFFEWLGAHSCEINCLNIDESTSTFSCREPYENVDQITSARWTGFVTPQSILNLLNKLRMRINSPNVGYPWIALTVHGFSDAVLSWGNNEHGYDMDGENLYCYILFPKLQYWLYKCLCKNDVLT